MRDSRFKTVINVTMIIIKLASMWDIKNRPLCVLLLQKKLNNDSTVWWKKVTVLLLLTISAEEFYSS